MSEAAPTVAVVAPTPSARAGLRALLCAEGLAVLQELDLDLELNIALPDVDVLVIEGGPSALPPLHELLARLQGTPVVIVGATRQEVAAIPAGVGGVAALRASADGPTIAAAVVAVHQGLVTLDPAVASQAAPESSDLSPRELGVLALLAQGYANKRLAVELGISEHTVKFHVSSVLAKLGAESRTEAVTLAARRGLVTL